MIGVNLIPDQIVWRQTRRRHLRRWAVAAVASLLLSAMPVGLEGWRRTEAEELREQCAASEEEVTDLRAESGQLKTTVGETFLQIQRAKALRAKRSWSAILAMVTSTIPEGCWLVSLATVPDAPAGAPAPSRPSAIDSAGVSGKNNESKGTITIEAPRALRLVGYAAEANEPIDFVTGLKNMGIFERVDLERSVREPVEDGSYFRFEIICEW